MTDAWFLLAFFVATEPLPASGIPSPPAQMSAIVTAGRAWYDSLEECRGFIPARLAEIRRLQAGFTIPPGSLGFICVQGVRP